MIDKLYKTNVKIKLYWIPIYINIIKNKQIDRNIKYITKLKIK